MKVYVDKRDIRSEYLQEAWKLRGWDVSENISESKLVYLGKYANDYLESDLLTGCHIYCLTNSLKMKQRCQECRAFYHCISDDREFIENNTICTVEAFLGYLIVNQKHSINGTKFLILGYGNLGKRLELVLEGLGGHVFIYNDDNYHPHLKDYYPSEITIIINTVPKNCIQKTSATIYDLASYPYGLKENTKGYNYIRLPSLPTYYHAPLAAKYLYNSIMKRDDLFVEE